MPPPADSVGPGVGSEEGFTLVELLVAAVLGLMIVGVGVTVFTAAIRSQPAQSDRGAKIGSARTTMERLVRELRQGATVYTAAPQQLSFLTYVPSVTCGGSPGSTARPCRVTYTCTAGSCARVEANPNGTGPGPARTVVSGLSSSDVFTYSPSPTSPAFIGATFVYPAKTGDDAITVSDGAAIRNRSTPR